jgi:hypothetical protein
MVMSMSAFSRFWGAAKERPPWEDGPLIFSLLREWDGNGAQPFLTGAAIASGNHTSHSSGGRGEPSVADLVQSVLNALKHLVQKNDDKRRIELYRVALKVPIGRCADELLDTLRRQDAVGPKDVRPHARWLVSIAAHREPLLLGVVLLGLAGTKEDVLDLQLIGKHNDFSPLVALAIKNLLGEST